MSTYRQRAAETADVVDETMELTLLLARYTDVHGANIIVQMRRNLRRVLALQALPVPPKQARASRIVKEVAMTGLEQELGL
jgi:hypothetical protein